MCGVKEWFSEYKTLKQERPVRLGDGHIVYGVGTGKIEVEAFN